MTWVGNMNAKKIQLARNLSLYAQEQKKRKPVKKEMSVAESEEVELDPMSEFFPAEGTTFTFCQRQGNLTKNFSVFRFDAFWKI